MAMAETVADTAKSPVRTVSTSSLSPTDPDEAYSQAMQQLDEFGRQDPAARDQLWKQLQGVKPSLWPLAIQQFRASHEFHRQLNSTESSRPSAGYPQTEPDHRAAPVTPMPPEIDFHSALPSQSPSVQLPPPNLLASPSLAAKPAAETLATYPTTSFQEIRQRVLQASFDSAATTPIVDVSASATNTSDVLSADSHRLNSGSAIPRGDLDLLSWRDSVDRAISQLDELADQEPHSRHEAYLHARLRLLQLVAGDKDAAVHSVPGLTPTEQHYWSQQLLAIATLLDEGSQNSADQRFSLASHHLAESAAKLSEMATLEVRNLVFCKQVHGFGEYDAVGDTNFSAGDDVRLYFEIEHFRSEKDAKGFRTSIDCSYEVIDAAGNRVDGAESAPLDDHCKSRRRDFFVEYTLRLPERIYPGKYRLKLSLRDRLADKIGTQTIEFQIVDGK
jgi:hypothetical protein